MSSSSINLLNDLKPILIFGKDGQVGRALKNYLRNSNSSIIFLGRNDCDLANQTLLLDTLERYQPKIIVNAAAYTSVDRAEIEQDLAYAINRDAVSLMARYIAGIPDGTLLHFSTDYVYSGSKEGKYLESDTTAPISLYGQSKLAGECGVIEAFQTKVGKSISSRYIILRTSWVYGDGDNFIRTILKLAGQKDSLRVVADQYGTPTSADWLASIANQLIESRTESGVYHAVPDGTTNWHELAVFVVGLAKELGLPLKISLENIFPIKSSEYPAKAQRPKNSCMNNALLKELLFQKVSSGQFPVWRNQVRDYVENYVQNTLKN